ncbi:MAG: diguanylate cyclase, partial [Clostridiales bacterium]|nr:diguanylate cyclase [Clostridiales bacterium]
MKQSFKVKVILVSVLIIATAITFPSAAYALGHQTARSECGRSLMLFSFLGDNAADTAFAIKYHNVIAIACITGAYVLSVLALLIISLRKKVKEHTQALEKLEQYKQLWQTYINADVGLVFLKDENLNYIFTNDAFTENFGHPQDEIIGRSDFDFMDKDLAETYRKVDLEVLEHHSKTTVRTFLEGSDRVYKTTKFPVQMLNGSFGVGAYISEITEEEKHIQEQMRSLTRNGILLEILSRNFSSNRSLLSYAMDELLKLSGSQYGNVFLYDEDTKELKSVSRKYVGRKVCKTEEKTKKYKLHGYSVLSESINRREPIIINETEALDLWGSACPDECPVLKNFVSVPVLFNDKIVVVAAFGNKETDYDEADIHEMTLIMSGIWIASQRRNTMETLAYERSKYYYTLLSIGDGVMVIDRNKKIEFLNTVACNLTGWKKEEALGLCYKDVFVLSHEQEGHTIDDPIEKVFLTGKTQELGNHAILTSRDGTRYYLEDSAAPIPNDKGEIAGVVLVFRDTTEKKEQRQRIEYMSFHDSLTGLYNRRFCEEELRRIDTERNLPISILMGDVNGLKLANDIFDHAFGDLLLKKVAEAMRNTCRGDDIIARWGGDEFIILLPKTDAEQAETLVERIKCSIAREQLGPIKVSISLGCDTKLHKDQDLMHVLGSAEEKM